MKCSACKCETDGTFQWKREDVLIAYLCKKCDWEIEKKMLYNYIYRPRRCSEKKFPYQNTEN